MIYITDLQYFGTFNYIKILFIADELGFALFERYQKSSFRSKMQLPGANGLLELSIPIIGGREQKCAVAEIKIDYSEPWQAKHFKSLVSVYNNSPWFEYYKDSLQNLYTERPIYLWEWNKLCLDWLFARLKKNANMAFYFTIEELANLKEVQNFIGLYASPKQLANLKTPKYLQIFEEKIGFFPNMCILDLLFCEGPNTINLLRS